jgi:hypothetical protein
MEKPQNSAISGFLETTAMQHKEPARRAEACRAGMDRVRQSIRGADPRSGFTLSRKPARNWHAPGQRIAGE